MKLVGSLLFALVAAAFCDQLCEEQTTTLPTDIILVVDRSNSIDGTDFETLKQVLSKFIVDGLSKTTTTRIAMVTYGGDVSLEFSFDDNVSAPDAVAKINAIDRSELNGMFTVTFNALELTSAVLVPEARPDANLYVVLFTDGASNANGMTKAEASARTIEDAAKMKSLRSMKVITVGIGDKINRKELLAVSSDGIENSTALIISGYQRLGELIDSYIIKKTVCNAKPIPKPVCDGGSLSAGVLVVPLVGTDFLTAKVDEVVNALTVGFDQAGKHVNVAWRNSLNGNTDRDSTFNPTSEEKSDFSPWVWVNVDPVDHGQSLRDEVAAYAAREDGTPVSKKFIIVLIDGSVLPHHIELFKTLGSGNGITVIPMDVSGNNGQYMLRKLAAIGGYKGRNCLFCGGIHDHSLHKCYSELIDDLEC